MRTLRSTVLLLLLAGFVLPSVLAREEALLEARARDAYADRDYPRGVAIFRELLEKNGQDARADYWAMMAVRGLSLAGDHERVVIAGEDFLAAFPRSRYFDKVAFETARAMLLTGRGAEGTELMAASVARLSGAELRGTIAGYYLEAAARAFVGVPSPGPFEPGTPPDYARALRLYGLARSSGIPAGRKADVLLRYAHAALMTKGYDLVLEVLDERAGDHELAADPDALLLRGRALIGKKRVPAAKDVLLRVAEEAAGKPQAAEALFLLDDPASLERLVTGYPRHPRAAAGAFRRGVLLRERGHVDRAVQAFTNTVNGHPDGAFAPRAALAAADTLLAAERPDEARARYDEFLRRFPENPEWAKARDRLTDAWYRVGAGLSKKGKHDAAAEVWEGLRTKYPLSKQAPATLLADAAGRGAEKALGILRELLARYPKSPQAPVAALRIATIYSRKSGSAADAVAAYRQVPVLYPKSDAARDARLQLKSMQEEGLDVRLPGVVIPGRPAVLEIGTRNLRRVEGRVYRIDPVAYFRKHGSLVGVENVMVEVMAPDAVFDHAVLDYEDFRRIDGKLAVPVEGEGAYIVVVEGGKLKATCLLLVSDLAVITKESPERILAFVQDLTDGAPVTGAEILVRKGRSGIRSAETGPDGVARISLPSGGGGPGVLAVRGGSVAVVGFGSRKAKVRGIATTVHISTDRPVYRPGHEVRFRAIVRQAAGEFVRTPAGERVLVTVVDRAGNPLYRRDATLSEFGTVAGAFRLPADIPPHAYAIQLRFGEKTYESPFHVEAYRKPGMFLTVASRKPVYVRGEEVEIEVRARYAFGRPMAGLDVDLDVRAVGIEGWEHRREVLTTDENGIALLRVKTRPGVDAVLRALVHARDVTRRFYYAEAAVPVTSTGYRAALSPERENYFSGEVARVKVLFADALGNPVAARGKVEVGFCPRTTRPVAFSRIETLPVETSESGRAWLDFPLTEPGAYRFYFRGADRTGREVNAAAEFTVRSAANRLVVRIDRPEHFVGDRMRVKLTAPAAGRFALLTIEGEEVYEYRVVHLDGRESTIEFEVDRRQVPEVWVAGALIHDGAIHQGIDKVTVHQEIRLEVTPRKEEYLPGELCRLDIVTKDDAGNPLSAEVAVAVVDEGLYLIRADDTPDLVARFRPGSRPHLVRTASSTGFGYPGKTVPISRDLLAERERRAKEPVADPAVMLEEEALDDAAADPLESEEKDQIGIGGGAGGAFGGRGGRRSLRAGGGGRLTAGAAAVLAPRKRFEDTAFFKADVVTGPSGKATVEFLLPDDLTEWRVTARGATHGNAFGSARASFLTARPLVVRAALPRFLREGDRLTGGAGVVNAMDAETEVAVSLRPAAAMDEIVETIVVPAGAERLVSWALPASTVGEVTFLARATTPAGVEDAEERTVPVLAYGVPWRDGFGGVGNDPSERTLILPEDAVPGTVRVTIFAAESLSRAALEGIGELKRFPYGCTEQTVNRFYPALVIAKAFGDLGMDRAEELADLDRIARAGALRLTYLQNREGLWGWWRRGSSNPEMTAYALIGLAAAREAGIGLSDAVFEKAKKALPGLLERTSDPDARAFLRLARARAFGADFDGLAPAFADRSRLSLSGLAYLALAYEPLGETAQHTLLVREIEGRAGKDADTESLGWALTAMAHSGFTGGRIHSLSAELAGRRMGRGFGTTRETGAVVTGLARTAALVPFDGPSRQAAVTVSLNGEELLLPRSGRITIPVAKLVSGKNRIRVSGLACYSVMLSGVRRDAPVAAGSLALSRRLALVPSSGGGRDQTLLKKGAPVREPEVKAVRIGEAVRVTLTVRTGGERYLVVEDPLPAGFESVPGTAQGPFTESTRHDDRMVFFLEDPKGEVTLSYLIQGEAPGSVRTPPAVVYAMYRPNASAYSSENVLTIADFGEPLTRDETLAYGAADLWREAVRAKTDGQGARAVKLIETLLDRFDLTDRYLVAALRALARIHAGAGDHAGAVAACERLRAEVPSFDPGIGDEELLAASFAALGRHGEAMGSLERVAWHLFTIDRRVPAEIGGKRAFAIEADLLDRYPAATCTRRVFRQRADRAALAFEEAVAIGREPDEDGLSPLTEYLARYPESAGAPLVAFRYARTRLRAGRFAELEALGRRFGDRYPGSPLCDDADWFTAYALFARGRLDEAEQFARASLSKEYVLESGERGTSAYRNNLVHLMAQVAHVKGRLDEAVALYAQVKEFSVDAREALRQLTEVRLETPAVVRAGVGGEVSFDVTLKNLAAATYEIYPIDLLVYFTLKKDVDRVASLNLDGLRPKLSGPITLSGEAVRKARSARVSLGVMEPGVYLVITRAGARETRGLIIVSDLTAEIRRHEDGVRVVVTHRRTGRPVPGAFVRVAEDGRLIRGGRTDLRGVFEVRGRYRGRLTAVAEKDGSYVLAK